MLRIRLVAPVVLATLSFAACSSGSGSGGTDAGYPMDKTLRLDQVQVLASHNSYHGRPADGVLDALTEAGIAIGLDYEHAPLAEQFDLGVRGIELDVYDDPAGGAFTSSDFLRSVGAPLPDPAVMAAPGFKVLHQAGVDTNSTCLTFVACLGIVEQWSDAHPGHVPIAVQIEMKDDTVTEETFGRLEAEIAATLTRDDYFTPDDVRGDAPTLGEAVRTKGWPALGDIRGKVYFLLDNGGLRDLYLAGHPSLRGRTLFTPSSPGQDDAAFAKLNDPVKNAAAIAAAIAANMLVRTRADADTLEARTNDTATSLAALRSGAQVVSTDYERPDPKIGTGYVVVIPDGTPARCSPVNAPPGCTPDDVENPAYLTRR